MDIEGAVRKRLGNEFLVEGDNLFANLIEARRQYVAKKGGGEPPVMVWNRLPMDGETFRGAQVAPSTDAENRQRREERLVDVPHGVHDAQVAGGEGRRPVRGRRDAGFISRASRGALTFPKTRRDGYWAFFHEIAEMTDEERRRMREEFLAFMRELGKKGGKTVSDAWEAYEAGKADDEQRAIVEAQMEGSKTVSDAWEAYEAGKADDKQRAIVEAQMEGSKTVSDAWEAYEAKADDKQRAIVEAQMEGSKTVSDALEAVRYDFENGTTTATKEQFDIAERVFAPRMSSG